MSTHKASLALGLPFVLLFAAGIVGPENLTRRACGQGFYFESSRGGFLGRRGVSISIGVQPSSPIIYGVRPSQIYPPIGFYDPYAAVVPGIPYAYRDYPYAYHDYPYAYHDYRAQYYDRLNQQYSAQLDAQHQYRVDPLHQSNVHRYLRGLSVPPLDAPPPQVSIEPFAGQGYGDAVVQTPAPVQMPQDDLATMLRSAAARLSEQLSRRGEEGEIWRDYLGPDTIIDAIDQGRDPRELGTLLLNYDGVLSNTELRWVLRTKGFAETRQLLRQYIQGASEIAPLTEDGQGAEGEGAEAAQRAEDARSAEDAQPADQVEPRDSETPPPPPTPSPIVSPPSGASQGLPAANPRASQPVPRPRGIAL